MEGLDGAFWEIFRGNGRAGWDFFFFWFEGFYEINEVHEVKRGEKESHAHSITSRRVRELHLRMLGDEIRNLGWRCWVESAGTVSTCRQFNCLYYYFYAYACSWFSFREGACWLFSLVVKTRENKKSRKEDRQSEYYDYDYDYDHQNNNNLDTYSILVTVLYWMVLSSHADTYSTGLAGGSTIQPRSEGSRTKPPSVRFHLVGTISCVTGRYYDR